MSEFVVVVVEPETPGNVGTIARAMKNFGLSDLKLVDPPEIDRDSEAYGFAGHAREDVLPNAETVTFDEVVERYHTVGCTAITAEDARSHTRFPFRTPAELRESLAAVETDTALVFGREGTGLNNDELSRLDEVCSIPASADYPVLNLGQAATVTLYELRELFVDETQLPDVERERASEPEIERLYDQFDAFLAHVEHREHKRERTQRLVRRLVGRTHPTEREVSTLTGVFRRAAREVDPDRESVVSGTESASGSESGSDSASASEAASDSTPGSGSDPTAEE
ncbi:RNA methyltransferase [Candidatus Halobonum tyrrellensis]|uniref:RNA methyltransferase, trmh family, group 1 n=1 Tax=Candidatus Halobonum tyrrellensis G22 TaxID=1324957 RepID=V4GT11_9EURY|nr:RNA methyltransferase [Candidatus Halobonum tyrrellensis]ESP88241.1 RNA methyltransferase, trmh family, group 1 [Candidatus Halobonum tyrrellensis G22]